MSAPKIIYTYFEGYRFDFVSDKVYCDYITVYDRFLCGHIKLEEAKKYLAGERVECRTHIGILPEAFKQACLTLIELQESSELQLSVDTDGRTAPR